MSKKEKSTLYFAIAFICLIIIIWVAICAR